MKLISWNVNGVRAALKKGLLEYLDAETPDVLCIQETKAHEEQLEEDVLTPPQHYTYWNSAEKRGYSGVATFTKVKPKAVKRGTEILPRDTEGRILMTEFDDFLLYNIYFPNGGRSAERLTYKLEFYDEILAHFEMLRKKKKSLVICGDVNTAHTEIDLKNPKENEKNSGFMPIERAWLNRIFSLGYVDTFRHFHPNEIDMYSWWDTRTRARERNAGWRIDYFIVTPEMLPRLKSASIQMEVLGSDHCPVVLNMK